MTLAEIEAATSSAPLAEQAIVFAEAAAELLTRLLAVAERQGVTPAMGRLEQASRAMRFIAEHQRKECAFWGLLKANIEHHRFEAACEGKAITAEDAIEHLSCALENRVAETVRRARDVGLPGIAGHLQATGDRLMSESIDREAARRTATVVLN